MKWKFWVYPIVWTIFSLVIGHLEIWTFIPVNNCCHRSYPVMGRERSVVIGLQWGFLQKKPWEESLDCLGSSLNVKHHFPRTNIVHVAFFFCHDMVDHIPNCVRRTVSILKIKIKKNSNLWFDFLTLKQQDYLWFWTIYQFLKQKVEDNVTYKLVVNDSLNEPSWIFFITGIVECNLNFCLHHTDRDMFFRFEGLDGMRDLCFHISSRKPKGMLC